ncbi:MAG TPA: hypothetical protein VI643_00240 [Planctomycetota bacterium]|nr:hypothetical protein [Planctomycetota bacterium]
MDRCPHCAEFIQTDAKLCPCCNEPVGAGLHMIDRDEEHLRLLSIFHYVYAGITAFCSSIPLLHVTIGIALLSGAIPESEKDSASLKVAGWMFVAIGGAIVLLGWTFAVLLFMAARRLGSRRGKVFCTVVAALSCLHIPLGTVLGVFTLLVLSRPSVQARLGAGRAPGSAFGTPKPSSPGS